MVFTAPAVHYSALATLPPELTSSKSQQSITHSASIRFKLSRIFKRLINNDIHNEHTITTEIEEHIQLPKKVFRLNDNIDDISPLANTGNRTAIEQESTRFSPSLTEPFERLPFTESYFSIPTKNEKFPFELSTYHKHCIHQQKYINQKQYPYKPPLIKQTKIFQPNPSSSSSSVKEHQLQTSIDHQQHQTKFVNKTSKSTTTLPLSTSIENRIGLRYTSRKNTFTNSHSLRSSHPPHLRRLHSKSKIRPASIDSKTSQKQSFPSSSIAQRIELLKQAMDNNQLEFHQYKSEKSPSIEPSFHKQTQTTNTQLKSSEIHHIHHHHIHSSFQWRTYLSILGTLSMIFFLFIELTTNLF